MNKKNISLPVLLFIFCLTMFFLQTSAHSAGKKMPNKVGMNMVFVPEGSFVMGSPPEEKGRGSNEELHRVTISRGFYISETEVTQGQWKKLMGDNPSAFKDGGDSMPVEQVSWNDCQEFIKKLNKFEKTDKYRLPTEAEWEYACRAGSTTAFSSGEITNVGCKTNKSLDLTAWYCGNSTSKPHLVATKKPNNWGLYDVHGNVSEWCLDSCIWRDKYTGRPHVVTDTYKDEIVDPISKSGSRRIFRGGSWNDSAKNLRSAARGYFSPTARRTYIGFRVVLPR